MKASAENREADFVDMYLDKVASLAVRAHDGRDPAAELRLIMDQVSTDLQQLTPQRRFANLKEFSAVLTLYADSKHIHGIARMSVFAEAKLQIQDLIARLNT